MVAAAINEMAFVLLKRLFYVLYLFHAVGRGFISRRFSEEVVLCGKIGALHIMSLAKHNLSHPRQEMNPCPTILESVLK